MGTTIKRSKVVTSFVQLHHSTPNNNHHEVRACICCPCICRCCKCSPGTFFKDAGMTNIEDVQINLKKIKLAGDDIEVTEGLLSTLNDNAGTINTATELLTTAADVGVYTGSDVEFTHESQS